MIENNKFLYLNMVFNHIAKIKAKDNPLALMYGGYLRLKPEDTLEKLKEKRNSLSEEFLISEAVNESPLVNKAVHMLKNGFDIYHVFEDTVTLFYKQDKERFEIIKKVVETCGQPFNFSAENK